MAAMAHVRGWNEEAKAMQQEMYELFGDRDWDRYAGNQQEQLLRNIGFAVYGQPDEEPDKDTNLGTGYSREKLKHIQTLLRKIQQQNPAADGSIDIAIIYVVIKLSDDHPHVPIPVFRMPRSGASDDSSNIFIDSNTDCRVYVGWTKYLRNNRLPQCTYCYPRNGVYYGDSDDCVLVDVSLTPACRVMRRLLTGVDHAGTAIGIGATVVSVSALAVPVSAPLLLGVMVTELVVGAWGAGRGVGAIVERKRHQQSIGVGNAESRGAYIALAANVLGMAAAGATKLTATLASQGKVLTTTEQVVVNATKISAITANGIGIVNGIVSITDKYKSGESVSSLEIFQLTSSILFFTQSIVSFKSAKKIVRETQQDVINTFEANLRSNRHRKGFQRLARNTREGLDAMNGDAKIIKSLTNIGNVDDFFAGVVRVQKKHTVSEAKMTLDESGFVMINNGLRVDPLEFASMDATQRQGLLSSESPASVDHPVSTSSSLRELVKGGVSVWSEMRGSEVQQLFSLARKSVSPEVLKTAILVAHQLGFTKTAEFLGFLDFISIKIVDMLNNMEWAYLECRKLAEGKSDYNRSQFDQEYGIGGNDRKKHFLSLIEALYSVKRTASSLVSDYEEYKEGLSQGAPWSSGAESLGTDQLSACWQGQGNSMSSVWSELSLNDSVKNVSSSVKRLKMSNDSDQQGKSMSSPETSEDLIRQWDRLSLERDFATEGQLSMDEIFNLAARFSGRASTKYNSAVEFLEEHVTLVVVMEPKQEDKLVLITADPQQNTVHVHPID